MSEPGIGGFKLRRLATWAAAVLLALPLVACSGGDGSDAAPEPAGPSATPRTPEEPLQAPQSDTCHRLDYAAAVQPTTPPDTRVKCARPHTSRTIKVGRLKSTVGAHFLAVDSAHVRRQPASTCAAAFDAHVGGTPEQRRLTMLTAVAFSPSVEESDQGGNWIRCDLVAVVGPETLGNLPGPLHGVLDTDQGRDRFGMCGTAEPGTPDFTRVACSRPHAWRAVASVDVPPGPKGRWPGKKTAQSAGQEKCAEAARGSATDALSYEWGYEWPDKQQWKAGRTHGFCWAPD